MVSGSNSASRVPSTNWSSRDHSTRDHSTRDHSHSARGRSPAQHILDASPVNQDDLQGASRATGGIFRGRALGAAFNLADAGMFIFIHVNTS